MINREIQIKFRMNKKEYQAFREKVDASGQTQQSFILNAIDEAVISSSEELQELKSMNKSLADYYRQVKGMAININQLAHKANATGRIPEMKELSNMATELAGQRKDGESLWQSIRQLISRQKPMGQ